MKSFQTKTKQNLCFIVLTSALNIPLTAMTNHKKIFTIKKKRIFLVYFFSSRLSFPYVSKCFIKMNDWMTEWRSTNKIIKEKKQKKRKNKQKIQAKFSSQESSNSINLQFLLFPSHFPFSFFCTYKILQRETFGLNKAKTKEWVRRRNETISQLIW